MGAFLFSIIMLTKYIKGLYCDYREGKKMKNANEAKEKSLKSYREIERLLNKIKADVHNTLTEVNCEAGNWGHVGDLQRIERLLKELTGESQ